MLIILYENSSPQGRFKLLIISDEGISFILVVTRQGIHFQQARGSTYFFQTIMGQMEL